MVTVVMRNMWNGTHRDDFVFKDPNYLHMVNTRLKGSVSG